MCLKKQSIEKRIFLNWFLQDYFLTTHIQNEKRQYKYLIMYIKRKIKLFLDSGAYSAYTKGASIDLNEYINFIKKHEKHFEVYANLDVIGNARETLKNQKIMEKAGLNPLPTFHFGEDFKYLKYYVKKYKYIALGGMALIRNKQKLILWLNYCFEKYICREDGFPKCKVHGFGMADFDLIKRFPWYSVDSTSWIIKSVMGGIYIPKRNFTNGKYDYSKHPWAFQISQRGQKGNQLPNRQEIYYIKKYIETLGFKLGKSRIIKLSEGTKLKENQKWAERKGPNPRLVEEVIQNGVSNNFILRDQVNIIFFKKFEETFPKWPWPFKSKNYGMIK